MVLSLPDPVPSPLQSHPCCVCSPSLTQHPHPYSLTHAVLSLSYLVLSFCNEASFLPLLPVLLLVPKTFLMLPCWFQPRPSLRRPPSWVKAPFLPSQAPHPCYFLFITYLQIVSLWEFFVTFLPTFLTILLWVPQEKGPWDSFPFVIFMHGIVPTM